MIVSIFYYSLKNWDKIITTGVLFINALKTSTRSKHNIITKLWFSGNNLSKEESALSSETTP